MPGIGQIALEHLRFPCGGYSHTWRRTAIRMRLQGYGTGHSGARGTLAETPRQRGARKGVKQSDRLLLFEPEAPEPERATVLRDSAHKMLRRPFRKLRLDLQRDGDLGADLAGEVLDDLFGDLPRVP